MALDIGNRKTLTREAANDDIAIRNIGCVHKGDVLADDVVAEISPIGFHCVFVDIVRPYDLVPGHGKPKVQTACTAKKRNHPHTPSFSNRINSSPKSRANFTGTAFPIWR